jgi:type I restriction enzyme R subunit
VNNSTKRSGPRSIRTLRKRPRAKKSKEKRSSSPSGRLEAVVGAGKRLKLVAQDIVEHFEMRAEAMMRQTQDEGKAMIVCMSRRICVELYREIAKLRPHWHDEADEKGVMKVIMTGSASDAADWQMHIRNKSRREELAKRFRNPDDPFKVVLVRDMWLTGFDAPSLHTMCDSGPAGETRNLLRHPSRL